MKSQELRRLEHPLGKDAFITYRKHPLNGWQYWLAWGPYWIKSDTALYDQIIRGIEFYPRDGNAVVSWKDTWCEPDFSDRLWENLIK